MVCAEEDDVPRKVSCVKSLNDFPDRSVTPPQPRMLHALSCHNPRRSPAHSGGTNSAEARMRTVASVAFVLAQENNAGYISAHDPFRA
jgi:hypothetical protein